MKKLKKIINWSFLFTCLSVQAQFDCMEEFNFNKYDEIITSISKFEDTNEYYDIGEKTTTKIGDREIIEEYKCIIGCQLIFERNDLILLSYYISGSHTNSYLCLINEGKYYFLNPYKKEKTITKILKMSDEKFSLKTKAKLINSIIDFYIRNHRDMIID